MSSMYQHWSRTVGAGETKIRTDSWQRACSSADYGGAEQGWAEVQIRRRAKPPDTQLSATETLELVVGYANAPKMERWQYQPDGAGGAGLGRALLMSPDDTIIQIPPVWVVWLRDHLGVSYEWCTSWYGMARVKGVRSRVVGKIPGSLV